MKKSELRKALGEYQTLAEQIATLEKERAAVADKIKRHMEAAEAEELTLDDHVIRYKAVTQSRFDTSAFRATYADLYNRFCKAATSKRFTVA